MCISGRRQGQTYASVNGLYTQSGELYGLQPVWKDEDGWVMYWHDEKWKISFNGTESTSRARCYPYESYDPEFTTCDWRIYSSGYYKSDPDMYANYGPCPG